MKGKKINLLIPMAGEGSRFKINGYENPKPLIEVNGTPMIEYAINSIDIKEANHVFVIRKYSDENHTKNLRELLNRISPECKIVETNTLTRGSAETCMLAKKYIDNDDELMIANCDQFLSWDSRKFIEFVDANKNLDSIVVTYKSSDPKNSFAKLGKSGLVAKIAEKNPISDTALIGVHYWRKGKDFVSSTRKMINDNCMENGEFYVAPTLNYLIESKMQVGIYHLADNEYQSLGTPNDLRLHVGKLNEFKEGKPRTIICDIDGTIFKHAHRYSNLLKHDLELNNGVLEKFDEWDSSGLKIILMTGRKESARKLTENQLEKMGIPYDQLIMNVGNGPRVIINDKLFESSPDRAYSVNVKTDSGFEDVDWKKIGL